MTRKSFKDKYSTDENGARTFPDAIPVALIPPTVTEVYFNGIHAKKWDFAPYYGKCCDAIVYAAQYTTDKMLRQARETWEATQSMRTIHTYCSNGLRHLFPFCELMAQALDRELILRDIDTAFIRRYIAYLGELNVTGITQRIFYNSTKSPLIAMGVNKSCFPVNPYPHACRQGKGQKPICRPELRQLMKALKKECRRIEKEATPLTCYDFTVCLLAIAARSGLNTTPLLELPTDCVQPHPFKMNRRLLVSFKRRGMNTHIQSIRKSEDVTLFNTVMMDVAEIIDLIIQRNNVHRQASAWPDRLFVYEVSSGNTKGQKVCLSDVGINESVKKLIKLHHLTDNDSRPLKLNVSRLRKTFINRIWELSGQDPMLAASLGGHTPKIQNDHYLEAPPEAEKNFRFLGELRVKTLLNQVPTLPGVTDTPNPQLIAAA